MSVYGLKYKTRVCEPQKGIDDRIRFFFATCSVVEENQIHLVEYSDDDEEAFCVNVYPHASEVVALASSPADRTLLATSYTHIEGNAAENRVGLWKIAGDEAHASLDALEQLPEVQQVESLLWEEGFPDTLFGVGPGQLTGWNVEQPAVSTRIPLGEPLTPVGGASLNPHFSSVVAVCVGAEVLGFDRREDRAARGEPVWRLKGDAEFVRDVDFNPNRPYFLGCGGSEGRLAFFDYRKPQEQVEWASVAGHSHWVSSVSFNPHHDSLILSSGTDGAVNLYNARSVSSAAQAKVPHEDYLVTSYDRFAHSVYNACWSASDAWVYAAVSFDGKALIDVVPEKEKMQILL